MDYKKDRFLGAFIGLAVGDAVGTTNEFKSAKRSDKITDMVGGGPFGLKPGEWTDDTSMALCLAASLLLSDGFKAADQLDRYAEWWRHGYMSSTGRCFDIGNQTSRAIGEYLKTGNVRAGAEGSPSNGSIMRLAPVPLYFQDDRRLAELMSAESSRTTHGNAACVQACAFLGSMIVALVDGEDRFSVMRGMAADADWSVPTSMLLPAGESPDKKHLNRLMGVTGGAYLSMVEDDVVQSGSVWNTLEAALYTFASTTTFRDGALAIAWRGDDSDTVGAVYGQIAGAHYGLSGIPQEWVSKLAHLDMLMGMANALYAAALGERTADTLIFTDTLKP